MLGVSVDADELGWTVFGADGGSGLVAKDGDAITDAAHGTAPGTFAPAHPVILRDRDYFGVGRFTQPFINSLDDEIAQLDRNEVARKSLGQLRDGYFLVRTDDADCVDVADR